MHNPDDGVEMGDAVPSPTVAVAETTTIAEATMLEEALRNKGIEVFIKEMQDTGSLPGFMQSQTQQIFARRRLLVPAADAATAEGVIREAIRETRRTAILQAFDPKLLKETLAGPWEENELLEMAELRERDPEVRSAKLEERMADWLADGVDEVQIAQRLAAAGLSFGEAKQLIRTTVTQRSELLRRAREGRQVTGNILVASGVLLFVIVAILIVLALVSNNPRPLFAAPSAWIVVGGAILSCAGAVIRRSAFRDPTHDFLVLIDDAASKRQDGPSA